uniref:sprouty-related, EVH1 domain-containing protein 2 isoform X1 n=2 Tax=Myxine glutinosa TaxID=7769 RepID=UPI00358DF3D4
MISDSWRSLYMYHFLRESDGYIVRVRAVVMTRDDSTGGWLPLAGGGISRVGIYKVLHHEETGHNEFLILGERLKDKLVVLECLLKKDVVYNKVTPIFHHWKVDDKKFGLTFQSPADARAFDRGVRKAIEDLSEGSTTSSSTLQNESEVGDDDVFANNTDSSSASSRKEAPRLVETSKTHGRVSTHGPLPDYRHALHFPVEAPAARKVVSFEEHVERMNPLEERWLRRGYEDYRHTAPCRQELETDDGGSYGDFEKTQDHSSGPAHGTVVKKHEYTYPYATRQEDKDDLSGRSRHHSPSPEDSVPLPRTRCVYCGELFDPVRPGRRRRCSDAPDPVYRCIERASCILCAETVLYHCMSDPEGEYTDPCSCDGGEAGDGRACQRWFVLAALSLIAPCMCCYLPLRACYSCGVRCGCCGGLHKAM